VSTATISAAPAIRAPWIAEMPTPPPSAAPTEPAGSGAETSPGPS